MEVGKGSMEVGGDLHGGRWRPPWRLMEVSMEAHGAPWRSVEAPWRSVEAPWRSGDLNLHGGLETSTSKDVWRPPTSMRVRGTETSTNLHRAPHRGPWMSIKTLTSILCK